MILTCSSLSSIYASALHRRMTLSKPGRAARVSTLSPEGASPKMMISGFAATMIFRLELRKFPLIRRDDIRAPRLLNQRANE